MINDVRLIKINDSYRHEIMIITLHLSWFDAVLYLRTYLTQNVLSDSRLRNNGVIMLR